MWYELNAKNHWEGKRKNVDHWGFSANEMDRYALKTGFKLVKQFFAIKKESLSKNLL